MAEHDAAEPPLPGTGPDAANPPLLATGRDAATGAREASTAPAAPPSPVGNSATDRAPGWREVLFVAGAIVVGVLALAVLTSLLPTGLQELVFRTPLAIAVLVVVTVGLLVRLGRDSGA